MPDDKNPESAIAPVPRELRAVDWVEMLQVLSVFAATGAAVAFIVDSTPWAATLTAGSLAFAVVSLAIVQGAEREMQRQREREMDRRRELLNRPPEFMLSPERLRILKPELPDPVVENLLTLLGERFRSEKEIDSRLDFLLGKTLADEYREKIKIRTRFERRQDNS